MSRFTRLEKPLMSPGECMACKGYALPVVDFNVSLQINGRLYLCEECLQEALITINPDAFKTDQTDWKAYAEQLEKRDREQTDGIARLRNYVGDISNFSGPLPERPIVEVDAESAGDNKATDERTSKGKPANKKRGPNDVSGSSIDELLGLN